jgi:threonine dehydrogenase-like Zn-dependent dehydrogenase
VVIEASGSNRAVNPALKLAGRGGRVVLLGSTRGTVDGFDPYQDLHLKGVTLIGAHASTTPPVPTLDNPWTEAANRRLLLNLMREGELDIERLTSDRVAPGSAGEIYAALEREPERFLGVVLDWSKA